jgi:hypothetical protein
VGGALAHLKAECGWLCVVMIADGCALLGGLLSCAVNWPSVAQCKRTKLLVCASPGPKRSFVSKKHNPKKGKMT